MKYAFFNSDGRVDSAHNDDSIAELPAGAEVLTDEQWEDRFNLRLSNGVLIQDPISLPLPTQEQLIKQYEIALDSHLDSVARHHRYDNRFTFALRAGYAGPYQAEAVAFAQWMDECNVQAFARMSRVLEGAEGMPTIESLIADLPVFILPA